MSIAIGIVTHPQRRVYAEQLQAKTNADIICTDDGRGPHANHVRTWLELADTDTEWSLVLEDDAIPVVNFTDQLDKALAACPTNIMSAYLGKSRPPQWQRKIADAIAKATANDACWITSTHLLHAVAVAMRTDLIPAMLANAKAYLPTDEALGAAARKLGEPIGYSYPSICDHADLPTLIRHRDRQPRNQPRKAWRLGGRDKWHEGTVYM